MTPDEFTAAWIRQLYKRVGHILQPAFEHWEFGFTQDPNQRRQLIIWEAIARTFDDYRARDQSILTKELAGMLAAISAGVEKLNPENEQTRLGREMYQLHLDRIRDDEEQVLKEVAQSLNLDH